MSEGQLNNRDYAGRPSMCRSCGALVGADETKCSLCGAPKDSQAVAAQSQLPSHAYDHETMRFARAILTRPYIFTIVFIIANVFVFILTSQAGAEQNPSVLINYGAKFNTLIDEQGEWWRFVTPIFLHGNIAHILMNMYGLWVIGPYVERLYGSAKFVFFWMVCGVAGVVASYLSVQPELYNRGAVASFLFKPFDKVSVGASGALFGLIGVLFVFGIKFRHELPEGFKRAFGTGMLPTILLNIFIGFMVPVIDNAAHMGGLAAGALLALVVGYKRPGERAGVAVFWHVLQFAALALVIVSFVMVARNFRETKPDAAQELGQLGGPAAAQAYLNVLSEGEAAFINALKAGNNDGVESALEKLERAPRLGGSADAIQDELKSLITRLKEFNEAKAGATKKEREAEKRKLISDFTTWQKKPLEWIKTEGEKYGIRLVEPDQPKSDSTKDK